MFGIFLLGPANKYYINVWKYRYKPTESRLKCG